MRVTFHKQTSRRLSYWEAVRGKRTKVPGTAMALGRGEMPHDLNQFIVEAALGISEGFWGCVDQGATFKSTGRKRTKPGRAVIAQNRAGLARAEAITGHQLAEWRRGTRSHVADELSRLEQVWNDVPVDGSFAVEWPTLIVSEPSLAGDLR